MEIRAPRRLSDYWRLWFDRAVAGSVVFASVVSLGGYGWTALPFLLGETLPLFWRRRFPAPVFLVVAAVSALQALAIPVPLVSQLAMPIAVYSVARYATAWWGATALIVALIGAPIASVVWLAHWDSLSGAAVGSYVFTISAIVIAAWALGSLGRTRQNYVDTLIERNEQLVREAAQRAELAAADERARIAREMHDVVAHGLSMIVVQADGARYAAPSDPAKATSTLETIADAARESLTDMRRLLGLLRSDDHAATAPQPTLADLEELVSQTRAAGTPVSAVLPGADARASDAVALTTYRIVQEALSNVRRHAGPGATATVSVRVDDREVVVDVTDDGRGAAAESDGAGLGLPGMRERVTAHDGSLEIGPITGGGFRVAARLPL